jgi:hypothetical protein
MAVTFVALWGNGVRITDPAQVNASVVVIRPWGYEVRVDLTDGTKIYNEVLTYPAMPTKVKVRDDVLALIDKIEASLRTKTITCQDGYTLEVLESILPVNVDLTITLTQEQSDAWAVIKPVLAAYLIKIMRVYRVMPADKQAELRAHNSLLDQVLRLVED